MNPYMQAPRWQPRAAVPIARGGGSTTRMIVTWRRPRTITNHDERRLRRDKATSFKRQLHIHVRPSADFYMRHASTMVQWQPLAGRHGQRPTPRTRMINLAHSCTFAQGSLPGTLCVITRAHDRHHDIDASCNTRCQERPHEHAEICVHASGRRGTIARGRKHRSMAASMPFAARNSIDWTQHCVTHCKVRHWHAS